MTNPPYLYIYNYCVLPSRAAARGVGTMQMYHF